MIGFRLAVLVGGIALLTAPLAACASAPGGVGAGVVAPVARSVGDLQGATVEVPMGGVLDIATGSLPVDSYTATVLDPSVASFVEGHTDGSAAFDPRFTPLRVGETDVTMTNAQAGIQPLDFTIEVVAAP